MSSDRGRLRAKAARFFSRRSAARREVVAFADELLALGPTVAIGGLLRDLHLEGAHAFRSDVDFVVHPASMVEFERFAGKLGGKPNRFGGVGVRRGRWRVDVWPLQRTWAHVHGHRRIERVEDLVDATFFDWDAVVYDLGRGTIVAKAGSLEAMASRILDINLAANPNPFGNAVRAMRYAVRHKARLAPALAEHVSSQIQARGWKAFVAAERCAFAHRVLDDVEAGEELADLLARPHSATIATRTLQRALPLCGGDAVRPGGASRSPPSPRRAERRTSWRPIAGEIPFA